MYPGSESFDDGGDPDFYITDDGCCSGCGYKLELDDLKYLNFEAEESGVQPSSPDGPAVHWATGWITCPNCQVQLPYEVSE
jgi:hypothetical protein